ncbi:unnamed protein product [Mytilus coruscus]|uniref:Uncharacterized protein n=1 Tax=Mytilus coruscus TaxID=42192 RepID=A0A6J8B4Q8_MYTCO|nr:unnamed protein product [Mytilus coruscus]
MPGRGKGLRSRRTPDSPCENLTTSDRQWDLNNPSNWTVQKLRELDKQGIKTPSSLSKSAPTPDSFTKTYDLANWYEQRNASDVPLIPVSGTTQRTAAHLNFSYSPSTSALPFSHHTSAEMDSTEMELTFGCGSSPNIFDTVSQAVCYIAEKNYKVTCSLFKKDIAADENKNSEWKP